MAAKLVAEEGILKGLVLSLEDGDSWVIGRDPDACQLLVEDPSASRKHMICRATPKGILVENLSETNPVQVNQQEVKEPRLLHNGDAVKIGDGLFRFYAEATAQLYQDEEVSQDKEISVMQNLTEAEDHPLAKEPGATAIESSNEPEEIFDENKSIGEKDLPINITDQTEEEFGIEPSSSPASADGTEQEEKENTEVFTDIPNEETAKDPNITTPEPYQENKEPIMDPKTATEDTEKYEPKSSPEEFPHETSLRDDMSESDDRRHDSIFDEEPSDKHGIAEINFGLLDTGRWLLKVISGPNNGAEFSMQTGSSYIIGTDPNACDIVFHDTSVSRQHTRITVTADDTLILEDLKSRNGTLINGEPLQGKRPLEPNSFVSVGTTSFVVFDREGEMQTIISPLMPSIVKVLQKEEEKNNEAAASAAPVAPAQFNEQPKVPKAERKTNYGALILIGILTGLFVLGAFGTSMLFRNEPVVATQTVDAAKLLSNALDPFPSVKYSFNPSTGQLLIVGHVLTAGDKSQLLYSLRGMNFIKNLDDNGVIIDEYVWREINQVLQKNPDYKGINLMATTPGHFVVSGYLQMSSQADRLSEYLSANFPYPNLLENRIVIEQELQASIYTILQGKGLKSVLPNLNNGEVNLTGNVPTDKLGDMAATIEEIKDIRGVRSVRNSTIGQAPELSLVNISDKYDVTGISTHGGKMSVVINGRILMKGDALDGMTITIIQSHVIYLEKDGVKYRIDINR